MEKCTDYENIIYNDIFQNVDVSSDNPGSKESLVAEYVRYALLKCRVNNAGYKPIHILFLKNWVYKKMRSIFPEISADNFNLFYNILSEGPGPSLEFLGDIISLSDGYYLPAPTRVIEINENTWTLISGLPTCVFLNSGLSIKIQGVGRWLTNVTRTDLVSHEIPIQMFESYIGVKESDDVTTLLDHIIDCETKIQWSSELGVEAYTGIPKFNGYGFEYWGSKPLEINHPKGILSLWRTKRVWGGYDYILTIKTSVKQPKPQLINKNGRPSWTIQYYEYTAIAIPSFYYKKICLALDLMSNYKRIAYLKKVNEYVYISINFSPTIELMRGLHAIGSIWQGYEKQHLNWLVPNENLTRVMEIFNYLGVDSEWV